MIEVNLDKGIADLRKLNADLSGQKFNRAVQIGLNEGIRKARTVMVREVIAQFNETAFTPSAVRKGLSIDSARSSNLTAKLLVSGSPLPIRLFSARQTSKGVSVEIMKGKRKVIKSAFITKLGGKRGNHAMARGKYESNQFSFRKKRINKTGPDVPISQLVSVGLPTAIHSEEVPILKRVGEQAEQHTTDRIVHAIERLADGSIT